jgi:signal transduction histidine kinase
MRPDHRRDVASDGVAADPAAPDPLGSAAALAGTVAHDLGNMLTVMLGNAELLVEGLSDRPDLAECATLILAAAQRGAELVARLDRLARRVPVAPEPVDPALAVAAWLHRVESKLPAGVTLDADVPPVLAPIRLPPAALTAALDELVGNALAALGAQGGQLRIAAGVETAPESLPFVRLTVEDNGKGMAPETLQRVRDLRFTSGVAGHKTGIGLPLVRRIAQAAGGNLRIESEHGSGSAITLYLAVVR